MLEYRTLTPCIAGISFVTKLSAPTSLCPDRNTHSHDDALE